jgi:hypothetical protein
MIAMALLVLMVERLRGESGVDHRAKMALSRLLRQRGRPAFSGQTGVSHWAYTLRGWIAPRPRRATARRLAAPRFAPYLGAMPVPVEALRTTQPALR